MRNARGRGVGVGLGCLAVASGCESALFTIERWSEEVVLVSEPGKSMKIL